MEVLKQLNRSRGISLCLICGVDSGPIRTFMFLFIGALVGASLFILLWARITRRITNEDDKSALVFQAEEREKLT